MEVKMSYETETEIEQDVNLVLITLVRSNSFIYDKADPLHKDRILIEQTWAGIACDLGLTVEETKSKWTRLRNNYLKAVERKNAKIPSVTGSKGKVKQWVYEPEMDFLKEHLTTYRKASSTVQTRFSHSVTNSKGGEATSSCTPENSSRETQSQFCVNNNRSTTRSTGPNRQSLKTLKSLLSRKPEQIGDCMPDYTNNAKQPKEDPLVGWFKSFIPHLNTLSPMRLLEFQEKVTCEVKNALSEESQDRNRFQIQQPFQTIPQGERNVNTETEYKLDSEELITPNLH